MCEKPGASQSSMIVLSIATFAFPALMSLVLLGTRAASILDGPAQWLTTSGGESISLYNIMKVQRGLPLYEDPRQPPNYPTTLYNAGFYQIYARATWAFRNETARLLPSIRFLTLTMACLGLAGMLSYALTGLRRRSSEVSAVGATLVMIFAAITVMLGAMPGWWLLTARPDIAAAACGAVALAIVLGFGTGREWTTGLSAGLCLALAWSFKQSCVLIFAGLLLSALVQRRYRLSVALFLPVATLAIAMATFLGRDYRYNAFFATSLSPFQTRNMIQLGIRLTLKGVFPLTAAILALGMLPHALWLRRDERISLVASWWTSLIGGFIMCCRSGSELNYFFELWVVVGFLTVTLARLMVQYPSPTGRRPPRLAALVLGVAALCSTAADAACLIGVGRFGTARLSMSPEMRVELENAKVIARQSAGAVFCQPALTGLALDLPFPAYVFDDYPYFHTPALKRGLLHGQGLPGLIADHHFRMIILQRDEIKLREEAIRAGYIPQPKWSHFAVFIQPVETSGGLSSGAMWFGTPNPCVASLGLNPIHLGQGRVHLQGDGAKTSIPAGD